MYTVTDSRLHEIFCQPKWW